MRPLPTTLSHRQSQFCINDGYRYPSFIYGPTQIALRASTPTTEAVCCYRTAALNSRPSHPQEESLPPDFFCLNFGKLPLGAENFPIFGHWCLVEHARLVRGNHVFDIDESILSPVRLEQLQSTPKGEIRIRKQRLNKITKQNKSAEAGDDDANAVCCFWSARSFSSLLSSCYGGLKSQDVRSTPLDVPLMTYPQTYTFDDLPPRRTLDDLPLLPKP